MEEEINSPQPLSFSLSLSVGSMEPKNRTGQAARLSGHPTNGGGRRAHGMKQVMELIFRPPLGQFIEPPKICTTFFMELHCPGADRRSRQCLCVCLKA